MTTTEAATQIIYTIGLGSEGNHIELAEDDMYRLVEMKIASPDGDMEGPDGELIGSMSVLLGVDELTELVAALIARLSDTA